jgi:hypothetical protein
MLSWSDVEAEIDFDDFETADSDVSGVLDKDGFAVSEMSVVAWATLGTIIIAPAETAKKDVLDIIGFGSDLGEKISFEKSLSSVR